MQTQRRKTNLINSFPSLKPIAPTSEEEMEMLHGAPVSAMDDGGHDGGMEEATGDFMEVTRELLTGGKLDSGAPEVRKALNSAE